MKGVFKDLTGQTFGRLTVTSRYEDKTKSGAYWNCTCICGNKAKKPIDTNRLIHGKTLSCGCFQIERVKSTPRITSLTKGTLMPNGVFVKEAA